MLNDVQLDMLSTVDQASNDLATFRKQRMLGPNGSEMTEIPLARIQLEPYDAQWMWSASINSANGSESGYKPFPKWGNFADSRQAAIGKAADEIREKLYRLNPPEQKQVLEWLGGILTSHR